jgi:hypothetical protein
MRSKAAVTGIVLVILAIAIGAVGALSSLGKGQPSWGLPQSASIVTSAPAPAETPSE